MNRKRSWQKIKRKTVKQFGWVSTMLGRFVLGEWDKEDKGDEGEEKDERGEREEGG